LLLQRLAQLAQQPRVLDGDDGLIGEALDQLDLFVGKCQDLLAVDGKGANQLAFCEHGNVEDGPKPSEVDGGHKYRFTLDIGGLSGDIDDVNRLSRFDDATKGSSRTRSLRSTLPELGKGRRYPEQCRGAPRPILEAKQASKAGL